MKIPTFGEETTKAQANQGNESVGKIVAELFSSVLKDMSDEIQHLERVVLNISFLACEEAFPPEQRLARVQQIADEAIKARDARHRMPSPTTALEPTSAAPTPASMKYC